LTDDLKTEQITFEYFVVLLRFQLNKPLKIANVAIKKWTHLNGKSFYIIQVSIKYKLRNFQ